MMKFQFNKGITTDGLPIGDMSLSEVVARRHAVYHAFILYIQREPVGHLFKEIYKLQIIHTQTGKEFWVEEESDIIERNLNCNKDFKDEAVMPRYDMVMDFMIKKCKEKYHMDKYFGFYMKKIKGRQYLTFKCKVCGLPYQRRKSFIRSMKRRGFKTSCCSARCKFKLLMQTHPSYIVIAKGILDWKPMKKIAEENGYTIDDKFRKTYDNIVKALNYGRKGMTIKEIQERTGFGYGSIRKIFIEAKFKRRKYERGTP
jgi:hypothetical protein